MWSWWPNLNLILFLCVCRSTPCRGQDHRGEWFSCGWDGTGASYPSCGRSFMWLITVKRDHRFYYIHIVYILFPPPYLWPLIQSCLFCSLFPDLLNHCSHPFVMHIIFWCREESRIHSYLLINPCCFFATNQQARSQGTIMFKVVPITERPVHNQTMVNHHLHLPHSFTSLFHTLKLHFITPRLLALRAGHGRLQPPAGPDHPLRRRRHELQKRRRPGDRGPDGRPLVAGQETAQQHSLRRPHPLHQPAETVRILILFIEDVICFSN